MIEPSTLISAMTASQLRTILLGVMAEKQAESAVEAIVAAQREDDLDLAEGPLDVILECLRGTAVDDTEQAELATGIYEALIDSCHLPGANAQRCATDALDSSIGSH